MSMKHILFMSCCVVLLLSGCSSKSISESEPKPSSSPVIEEQQTQTNTSSETPVPSTNTEIKEEDKSNPQMEQTQNKIDTAISAAFEAKLKEVETVKDKQKQIEFSSQELINEILQSNPPFVTHTMAIDSLANKFKEKGYTASENTTNGNLIVSWK